MSKSESKYFHTQRLMNESLAELIQKKKFKDITVKDVCLKAGVSRSTFYLHYDTTSDLIEETITNLQKNFVSHFNQTNKDIQEKIKYGTLEDLNFITKDYLKPYLNFILENKNIYYAYCTNPKLSGANKSYSFLIKDVLNPILDRFNVEEKERSYMISFFINGSYSIINLWIKNDCSDSIDDIVKYIIQCVRPMYHISGKDV